MKFAGKAPKWFYITTMGVFRSISNVAADDFITDQKIREFFLHLLQTVTPQTYFVDFLKSRNFLC